MFSHAKTLLCPCPVAQLNAVTLRYCLKFNHKGNQNYQKSKKLVPKKYLFLLVRGAAGTGATGASAPVDFWLRVRRTRPEDKDHSGICLGLASEVINVSYLHWVFGVFSFVPWKLLIEAKNLHFYRLKLSYCCTFVIGLYLMTKFAPILYESQQRP